MFARAPPQPEAMDKFLAAKPKPTAAEEDTASSSLRARVSALETELAAVKAELAAVKAERDTLRAAATASAPAAPSSDAPAAKAAPPPAAPPSAAAPTDVGKVLHETAGDVPFLTPRGRFKIRFCEYAMVLVGKSTEVVIPCASMGRAFFLPENSSVGGSLLIVSLSSPAQNGKTAIHTLTLHSKPSDPVLKAAFGDDEAFAGRAALLLRDCLTALVQRGAAGAPPLSVSELGSFKPVHGSALACYNKAAEASCYLLDSELLVREGGKVTLFPYKGLRAEVLPPSGRRTFDIQLRPAAIGGIRKATKMELSMIAAEECNGVATFLKRRRST